LVFILRKRTKRDSCVNDSVKGPDLAGMLRVLLAIGTLAGVSESKKLLADASYCIVLHHSTL
jgi:hypothetical protein